jgi:hypothetical protein
VPEKHGARDDHRGRERQRYRDNSGYDRDVQCVLTNQLSVRPAQMNEYPACSSEAGALAPAARQSVHGALQEVLDHHLKRSPPSFASGNALTQALWIVVGRDWHRKVRRDRTQSQDIDDPECASRRLDLCTNVHATAPTQEKVGGPQSKSISFQGFDCADAKRESPAGVGRRKGAVSPTEPALAGANVPLDDRRCGVE